MPVSFRQIALSSSLAASLSACGTGSSSHEDIGVLDAATCAKLGQIFIPGNAERRTPDRCAVVTSGEALCHLSDQKFDPATRACVAAAESDFPQRYLPDAASLLSRVKGAVTEVCVGGPAYGELDRGEKVALGAALEKSVHAWLATVQDLAPAGLGQTVSLIVAPAPCPATRAFDVRLIVDPVASCGLPRGGCVVPSESVMYLVPRQGTDLATVLHEVGHIMGIQDYYYDPQLENDGLGDAITGCIKGFFGSVMCHPRRELGPADRAAMRKLYCALSDAAACPKPAAFDRAHYGDALMTCEATESTPPVDAPYRDDFARRAQFPYDVTSVTRDGETLVLEPMGLRVPASACRLSTNLMRLLL